MRLADRLRSDVLFQSAIARYGFSVAAVAVALALRLALMPLTGAGAPFVLFFGATLVTSLLAGVGPAVLTVVISLPIAATLFVVHAGYTVSQAVFQSSLYGVDGLIIAYMTILTTRRRQNLQQANRQLVSANEERARSLARVRETIELAPEAYFLADLDAHLTDMNQAACRLLGYERDELLGKTIFDIIPAEEHERLNAVKAELLVPGKVSKAEWTQKRKDGTLVPVEVSSNILPDGRWQAFVRDISKRKRIEDVRQVFVSLLDNSSDFIGIADPTGKPIYVNAAGRRMTGLTPDFPVEQTQIQDYYPPELRSFVTDVILKSMIESGQWSGETQFRNFRTGEPIPVSDTHFLIRDASGERILGMGTVTRDISEARRIAEEREQLLTREQVARRQAESANAQLRESEERFRLTIEEAPIGMALVALDGRFVRVNRALCEITGYRADELTQLTFQRITHPDDLDNDVDAAVRLARGEIPRYQRDKRYIRKNGSVVDVMLSVSVLRGPDGAARYYISQMEDITARKRADEALRLSEAKFSGIVSISADGIISVDENQRITVFNEGAEKIYGYSKREAIGMRLGKLIPERFRAIHDEHFARFAAGRELARPMGERREIFGLRKNGEEFPAEASISKVAVGGATFFSVVVRDITQRKNVEEALRRAVTARDDVLGIVAHDLRNPLNTILMQSELLERPGPEPERRDQTPRLVLTRSAKRMNHLIQDLLDVAAIEAGQLKVRRERLSALDLTHDALEAQRPLAASSGLEMRLEVGEDVGDVWGDRGRLLQVFENLIGNAIKFTKEGGRITLSAEPKENEVVFAVADTGCGIAPENVPHAFERFWQAATRASRLGAGLGLPITRGIVEAHGGRIWVESAVGRGSTFFFTIPAATARTARPTDVTHAGQQGWRNNPRKRRQRT
ncbi:MAG TPA: PAS domain S-box protein [Gemmatimonadaceae bacterium]|nr:PAS domain S-box protein [Gemmatimonadaceae bacterium]